MEIRIGKYILKSDAFCYWIEEEYEGKDKNGRKKKSRRRVAGYVSTLDILYRQFVEHKHKASEATTVAELVKDMKECAEDIEAIKKTATKEGLTKIRRIGKKVKEINATHNI